VKTVDFVLDDRPVQALFRQLVDVADRPAAALEEIGDDLVQSTRLRFDQGAAPDGSKWKPLATATIIARAARGRSLRRGGPLVGKTGRYRIAFARAVALGDAKPLMDTRQHLYQSLTYQVQGNTLIWGVGVKWGTIHQFGGMAGRGKKVRIPARPYLGISKQDRDHINAILTRRVLAASSAGFR
jgi:phage gpG-like protein